MKTYEGEVKLLGAGVGDFKERAMTVFEIGDHELKKVILPRYLDNYVNVGDYVKVLIGNDTLFGITTSKTIYGVKRGEKIYTAKKFSGFLEFIVLLPFFSLTVFIYFGLPLAGTGTASFTLILLILVILFFMKGYSRYKKISNFGKE